MSIEPYHPDTLAPAPVSTSRQLRVLVDELLDTFPHMRAAAAAEAAAKRLGLYCRPAPAHMVRHYGGPAVDIAVAGQHPRWQRWPMRMFNGMWASGTWLTVTDQYRSGQGQGPWVEGWPMGYTIGYR